jgi:hypothetical protein
VAGLFAIFLFKRRESGVGNFHWKETKKRKARNGKAENLRSPLFHFRFSFGFASLW